MKTVFLPWNGSIPKSSLFEKREQALFHSEQFAENVKNRLELHQEQLVTDSAEPNDFPQGHPRIFLGF